MNHEPAAKTYGPPGFVFAAGTALALLVFLVYLPSLHGGFIWDDLLLVNENPLVTIVSPTLMSACLGMSSRSICAGSISFQMRDPKYSFRLIAALILAAVLSTEIAVEYCSPTWSTIPAIP